MDSLFNFQRPCLNEYLLHLFLSNCWAVIKLFDSYHRNIGRPLLRWSPKGFHAVIFCIHFVFSILVMYPLCSQHNVLYIFHFGISFDPFYWVFIILSAAVSKLSSCTDQVSKTKTIFYISLISTVEYARAYACLVASSITIVYCYDNHTWRHLVVRCRNRWFKK